MTVESEVPTDILIQDLVVTSRKDITHNTVEGIMYEWNRVVLHPSTLHSQYIEGYIKVVLETDILLLGNLVFIYLHIFHVLITCTSTIKQWCLGLAIWVKV